MKIVADLHLHSKYSRAVSQQMDLFYLEEWAKKKGIDLLGTGDFTHPLWFSELETKLKEVSEGIYVLKDHSSAAVNFVLTCELSSIYSQGGRLRRIHNLVFAPSLATAKKINQELTRRGVNLLADGRPTLGLSAIHLAELIWSLDENCLIIPAHVWTPWFSLYGSKSGFDSLEECFGNFQNKIYAIETGLSSDPAMNWRIEELKNRSILSFSDAHSPTKLGREATVFKIKNKSLKNQVNFSFKDLAAAIKQEKEAVWEISHTIEFYPEEGKYHYTGHRHCQISQSPQQTKTKGFICPVCGKPLTVGVMSRVEELASFNSQILKKESHYGVIVNYSALSPNRPPYIMLVPLLEILTEALKTSSPQKLLKAYENLIQNFQSELTVLIKTPIEQIAKVAGERVAEGIDKVRHGKIVIKPGFDGLFGLVKIWPERNEKTPLVKEQMSLF